MDWRVIMDNLFQIGGQVSGDSFIGREKFVKDIQKNFIDSKIRTAKSIVGLTRMGKSSAIINSFSEIPEKLIYIYENLSEFDEYCQMWQDICYKINSKIKEMNIQEDFVKDYFSNMEKDDIPWIALLNSVKFIFKYLSEKNIKTILVLDEFDNASELFGKKTNYFELLRTIFSGSQYNVFAITISRRNLYTIEGATYQSSTFHGVLDIVHFKGFNELDMKEYFDVFTKYQIYLDENQKEKIIYYAGNVPYLLSIIGHYIIETINNDEDVDIDKIFLDKCKAINDYYRDCIKHLERDNDLRRMIPFVIGPNVGVTQNDKDELFNLGYFREEDGKLIAISEYFMEFLSVNMLEINIWDNIISLEKKLKQLIEREMTRIVRHYSATGDNLNDVFHDIMEKTSGINAGDVSRYDSFISKNKTVFSIDSTYLDVMSMADAIKIMKECWNDIFSEYFNNDLYGDWKLKFEKCSRARNPVAHGHEEYLSDLDKQEVDTYCKQVFDSLAVNIKKITPVNTPYLIVAKNNLASQSFKPSFSGFVEHVDNLLGETVDMKVLEIGGKEKNNLRGKIDEKYKAVIPSNYLKGIDLKKKIGQKVTVVPEKINHNQYQVRPVSWDE